MNIEDFNKEIRYYLAGPMSGHKHFNLPLFYEVASLLRAAGLKILNPAELDTDEVRSACLRSLSGDLSRLPATWGDMLGRDVKAVSDDCQGLILLPGWERSKGARLEAFVALLKEHVVYQYTDKSKLRPLQLEELREGIIG
jgi:hypothetical protein